MKCRTCERDLHESDFYWKPGGGIANPDCKLCYGDAQAIRGKKRGKIFDWRDVPHPMDRFLRSAQQITHDAAGVSAVLGDVA